MEYLKRYEEWLNSEKVLPEYREELSKIEDQKEIEDRFYKELEFGTAGLRGVLGAGTNRMNEHTVGKATEGLARFLSNNYKDSSVAIAYDSRIKSDVFAKYSAQILAAHGIKVYIFDSLRPVPVLSFAVRELKTTAGIVITASHNPSIYNGYKVYAAYGGQITDEEASAVLKEISLIKSFDDIHSIDFEDGLKSNIIEYISKDIDLKYYEACESQTIRKNLVKENAKDLKIIYSPLHGSGNIPVRSVLSDLGYTDVHVVKEQELPDGTFPTTSYPNPENADVFDLALKLNQEVDADIIFATDPDADRLGVVVFDKDKNMRVLTGNQTGMLLTNYVLKSLSEENKLPENPAVIKTIVSTESVKEIAKKYKAEVFDVLTGFKYIGEKIEEFNANNSHKFVIGFEESFGYLIGEHARDKDAIVASMMVCEMAVYYKSRGMTLYDGLTEVYEEFGYYLEAIKSFTLEGKSGQEKIKMSLETLRETDIKEINGVSIIKKEDYLTGRVTDYKTNSKTLTTLPKSNVLKYTLEDGSWFVVRPSGTEPKMKVYFAVVGKTSEEANKMLKSLRENITALVETTLNGPGTIKF